MSNIVFVNSEIRIINWSYVLVNIHTPFFVYFAQLQYADAILFQPCASFESLSRSICLKIVIVLSWHSNRILMITLPRFGHPQMIIACAHFILIRVFSSKIQTILSVVSPVHSFRLRC